MDDIVMRLSAGCLARLFAAASIVISVFGLGSGALAATPSGQTESQIERVYVAPGATIVLASGPEQITAAELPVEAHIFHDPAAGTRKDLWAIAYVAPREKAGGEDVVSYKKGDASFKVLVTVSAQPQVDDPQLIWKATRVLFSMFVLAVILESALAVVFNWRVFLEFFDGRGVRTLVMFAGAFFIVKAFDQDFVSSLFQLYLGTGKGADTASQLSTQLLTALVLAGGSASVNQLMVSLGLRENKSAEQVVKKPPKDKAWISVVVTRNGIAFVPDDIDFKIMKAGGISDAEAAKLPELMGVIRRRGVWARLWQYFWRDPSRLPMSGGLEVDPSVPMAPVVLAKIDGEEVYRDANGDKLTGDFANGFNPSPKAYKFAKGAIVDFVVRF